MASISVGASKDWTTILYLHTSVTTMTSVHKLTNATSALLLPPGPGFPHLDSRIAVDPASMEIRNALESSQNTLPLLLLLGAHYIFTHLLGILAFIFGTSVLAGLDQKLRLVTDSRVSTLAALCFCDKSTVVTTATATFRGRMPMMFWRSSLVCGAFFASWHHRCFLRTFVRYRLAVAILHDQMRRHLCVDHDGCNVNDVQSYTKTEVQGMYVRKVIAPQMLLSLLNGPPS